MDCAARSVFLLASLLLAAATVGCGQSVTVSGKVRFDGKPLPEGSIRFFPAKGTPGDGAAAKIVEGDYLIPVDSNLRPGTYSVMIVALKETGKWAYSPDIVPVEFGGTGKREKYKERVQYIPEKYNYSTTLQVVLDQPANSADFQLDKQ